MRNLLRTASSIALAASAITLFSATGAHAQNLAVWNFNFASGTTPTNITAAERAELFSVDGGVRAGTATLSTTFAVADGAASGTIGITTFTGTTTTALAGTPAGQDLALQASNTTTGTPNNGQYLQFGASTAGFNNIMVMFAFRNTATGFTSNQFQYSTDGTTFTSLGAAFAPGTTYTTQTFDLSSVAGIANNANAQFRILFSGATSSNGNARIDNLQINSGVIAVPEPGTFALLALGGLPVVGLVARRRKSK